MTTAGFQNLRTSEDSNNTGVDISYTDLVEGTRKTFLSGKTKNVEWRRQQLGQLKKLIRENHEAITEAILADHKGPKIRGTFDMTGAIDDIAIMEKNLDSWTKDQKCSHDSPLGRSYVRYEPKGVVLLIAPWNFPFAMVFDPLVPIIAAGNCCVIKPSEVSENSCRVIAELLPKYMDPTAIRVVTGAVPETTALLREKFDHIMYTGNGHVGRIVMTAAAKNLTPVTLELGGKSPTYIDKSAKLSAAVNRVFMVKFINCGQICVCPDYILLHKDVVDDFKKMFIEKVKSIYGRTAEEREKNPDFPRIINSRHAERITRLINTTSGSILLGGESDIPNSFVQPTLIENPSLDDAVLREEIFGPVLPFLVVEDVVEAAEKTNLICAEPLALYIFAEDQGVIDYFLDNTKSGGVCVNTTLEHLSNKHIPFGGVGESGMGHYHGKWGFDEFSHVRSVLVRTTLHTQPTIPLPPYNQNLYDIVVKFAITGLLNDSQKRAAKVASLGAAAAAGLYLIRSRL